MESAEAHGGLVGWWLVGGGIQKSCRGLYGAVKDEGMRVAVRNSK